jgi:CDP-4-dehydro-6-deoxyglucose reductase, E3
VSNVIYAGVSYAAIAGEAVLDTLLRHDVAISNSCRAGACQSCLMRATEGAVPAVAQRGIKATLVAQGYFLSCACVPATDLRIEPANEIDVRATIAFLDRLTSRVLRVRLKVSAPLGYRAGQYVTLRRADGLSRSYSLASLPDEDTLELHVRLAPHGRMSSWLFNEASAGDCLTLRGPAGDCFYTAGNPAQPLLLIGIGTGLAPLAGICRDALRQGHTGAVHLYHGAPTSNDLYLQEEIDCLQQWHRNLQYTTVVPPGPHVGVAAVMTSVIQKRHRSLAGWRGFVCGHPAAVTSLKMKMFMLGMGSQEIFADAFREARRPS